MLRVHANEHTNERLVCLSLDKNSWLRGGRVCWYVVYRLDVN